MARRESTEEPKRGGLFEGISFAQIIAGALAAVTSMLLASRIGIAGSVIGVGVGSVVSALASQLYKKFLTASAQKLRELRPDEAQNSEPAHDRPQKSARSGKAHQSDLYGSEAPSSTQRKKAASAAVSYSSGLSNTSLRKIRSQRDHKKKIARRVVLVSVVSALIAVLISALIIEFSTGGQGVGERPAAPIKALQSSPPEHEEAPDNKEAPDNHHDRAPEKDTPSNQNSPNDKKSDGGNDKSEGGTSDKKSDKNPDDGSKKDGSKDNSDAQPDKSDKSGSDTTSGGGKGGASGKSGKSTESGSESGLKVPKITARVFEL